MKPLAQIEALIAEIVERPAWLLSSRRLHPLALTSALTRALEERALRLADRVIAPDDYELRLNRTDLTAMADLQPLLERELADFVARLVAERDLACNRPPRVTIAESDEVRQGRVGVSARFSATPAPEDTVFGYRTPPVAAPARRSDSRQRTAARGQLVALANGPRLELTGELGEAVETYPLRPGATVIGRRIGCEITLSDGKVSREHARIELTGGVATLRDLGSLNGTLVNGHPLVAPRELRAGDIIEIGRARLRFAVARSRGLKEA